MLRALFRAYITRMEKDFDYDASYMRDILAVSPWTFLKFAVVTTLVPRRGAPGAAVAAAGIVGTLAEDCGPCTQISVEIATRGGVKPEVLRAILAGDEAAMGENAALWPTASPAPRWRATWTPPTRCATRWFAAGERRGWSRLRSRSPPRVCTRR